jgi:hypothetical protein
MSGPGGSTTKRDDRRNSRRAQFEQRQAERRRERERKLRNQRIRRYSVVGGSIVAFLLIGFLVIHAVVGSGGTSTGKVSTGPFTTPANGDTRNGLSCLNTEGTAAHYHAYLAMYVNGLQVSIPAGIGIVAPPGYPETALASNGNLVCYYPLHVHAATPNVIHIESPVADKQYTLGMFFDIWGQPLSSTQVWKYKADSAHPLTFEVFDASGKLTKVTGNPRDIVLQAHQTIVVLYNSPNVQPQPFTQWNGL